MKNVHLINAKHAYAHSQGEYTDGMFECAKDFFLGKNYNVTESYTHGDYDIGEEVKKLDQADFIIAHTPFWWMGLPWSFKKYIDEVITEAHGVLYANDGRSRKDQGKLYGSGGLKPDVHYMLCMVMNAPTSVFDNPESLFEGASFDQALMQFHKTFQFLAMKKLPSFHANDVMKVPQFDEHRAQYEQHLKEVFKDF